MTAAEFWVLGGNSDDMAVEAELKRQGCDPQLADILVEFLPVSFSENAISILGLRRDPVYSRKIVIDSAKDAAWMRVSFANDPVFAAVNRYRDVHAAAQAAICL